MKYMIGKYDILIMKKGEKVKIKKNRTMQNRKASESSEKTKIPSTCEYWERTLSEIKEKKIRKKHLKM